MDRGYLETATRFCGCDLGGSAISVILDTDGDAEPGETQWQIELASIDRQIADAFREQGDLPGALKEFRTEIEIRTPGPEQPNDSDRQYQTAVTHNRIETS